MSTVEQRPDRADRAEASPPDLGPQIQPWREPAWLIVFALCWLSTLVPIWWPRLLPLLDQPNHLALIALWHRLGDASWHYQDFYQYSRWPIPYWGYYFPVHLLAYVFPVEIANKIYLSIYAAALPLSVAYFARRFDRSPWLALLTFPFVFNFSFAHGFLSFCAGLPTMLTALAVLDEYLASPSRKRLTAVWVLALATFFMHLVPWLLLGVCVVPVLAARLLDGPRDRESLRARVRTAGIAAAALLSTVVIAIADFRIAGANAMLTTGGRFELSGKYELYLDALTNLPERLISAWPGDRDEQILVLLAISWALLAATARATAGSRASWGRLRDWIPELCFVVAAAGYLFLPFRTYKPIDWWLISPRLAVPAALFGALFIRGPVAGKRRLLLLPALIAALAYPLLLAGQYREFNTRAAGFFTVMKQVPRGSSTLTLMLGSNVDPALDPEVVPFQEFHSYAQLLGGGFNPYQTNPGFPVAPIAGKTLPSTRWNRPLEFDQAKHGSFYDFVLTHNESADGNVFKQYASRVHMVAKDGTWRLYATRGIQ